ncbi:MAG: pseudouridine synthase [Salibacteraceae bacterium]|nr:pseudouridine synthase [Salibacteraceae bacterium]|tara:strand:+ start:18055 stop:18636 length:582 start_codon:yes stop_codon:yes gene_type:complete
MEEDKIDFRYFIFYKPFGYLSQFTDEDGNPGLSKLIDLPKDIYPIGRLDKDSEGLLLLSNDKKLNFKLLNPENNHNRTYWVQVDTVVTTEAILALENGVSIKVGKTQHQTKPCVAKVIDTPALPDREPPVRFRKNVPTSWIEITLTEGKNRQVRKMCAAVGFPCLRLVRVSIERLELQNMKVGQLREVKKIRI